MAFDNLRKGIFGPAAAVGMSVAAAMSPLGAAFANDSAPDANATTISATSSSTASLTPEQIERLEVDRQAYFFALENRGKVGITVLRGEDAREYSADDIVQKFEQGFLKNFGINAQGFSGHNKEGSATAIVFHYLEFDSDGKDLVISRSFNLGGAVRAMPEISAEVKEIQSATNLFAQNGLD